MNFFLEKGRYMWVRFEDSAQSLKYQILIRTYLFMAEYEISFVYPISFAFSFSFPFWLKFILEKSSLDINKLSKDRVLLQLFPTDLRDVFVGMDLELHKLFPSFIASYHLGTLITDLILV